MKKDGQVVPNKRQERTGEIDTLTAEFDALLERMQTPQARAAMRRAFDATPEELGRAAVEYARRERDD
jgi:hypothetical protein